MILRQTILTTLFLTVFTMSLSAQRAMSLEDCVQYAFTNHPEVALAQLDIQDADWQIKENTATALPQFTAGVNYSHYLKQPAIPAEALGFPADPGTKLTFALKKTLAGNIGVDQLLFSHSYLLGVKAAREYRKYVDLNMEAMKVKVRNAVTDAYLPALLVDENIEILDRNIDIQEKLVHETNEVFKAGFAEQLDVDRLQYTLSRLRNDRANLARQREVLVDLLQFAMHMPVQEEITLTDNLSILLESYAQLSPETELDLQQKPEYVALLKARELSDIQVDLYRRPWLPTLSGFAQYQPSFQGNTELFWVPAALLGLRLNFSIYDGGMSRARRERAIVTSLKTDVQLDNLDHAMRLELETSRKTFANALSRVEDEQENLDLAQRIYDTSQTKFSAGIGSSVEVTQAQAGLYQSQAALIQARYELLQARVALKKALNQ